MKHDLETLKEELYNQFEKAVAKQGSYSEQYSYSNQNYPNSFPIQNRKAIAALGALILDIEKTLDERDGAKPSILKKGVG